MRTAWPCSYHAGEGMMTTFGRPGLDWTVVLRRQPARLAAGEPEGGFTDMFEIICCDCGDDPDLDYREVSPRIQRIRGPYPIVSGVAAYEQHLKRHPSRKLPRQAGAGPDREVPADWPGPPGMTQAWQSRPWLRSG